MSRTGEIKKGMKRIADEFIRGFATAQTARDVRLCVRESALLHIESLNEIE